MEPHGFLTLSGRLDVKEVGSLFIDMNSYAGDAYKCSILSASCDVVQAVTICYPTKLCITNNNNIHVNMETSRNCIIGTNKLSPNYN